MSSSQSLPNTFRRLRRFRAPALAAALEFAIGTGCRGWGRTALPSSLDRPGPSPDRPAHISS
jgi:hypothetical protein